MSKLNETTIYAFQKGYRVRNGIIKYKKREVKSRLNTCGYKVFCIRDKNGDRSTVMVHRLVAYQKYGNKAFDDGIQVRHKNGNKNNNKRVNILIGTPSQNSLDKDPKVRVMLAIKASDAIKKYDHEQIIKMHENGMSYKKIMNQLNIKSKGTISFIIKKSIEAKK